MSDLFEDPAPIGNAPEFTVSELSGAVKRVIEGEFGWCACGARSAGVAPRLGAFLLRPEG